MTERRGEEKSREEKREERRGEERGERGEFIPLEGVSLHFIPCFQEITMVTVTHNDIINHIILWYSVSHRPRKDLRHSNSRFRG